MAEFDIVLDKDRLDRLRRGAVFVETRPSAFELTGIGALTCLQGLLTNDVVQPGDGSLVYGALLTPKGMLVVDYWVIRQPGGLTLLAPPRGHAATLELFQRQLPPRLARAEDRTGEITAIWLFGEQAVGTLRFAGIGSVPETPGRVLEGGAGKGALLLARPGPAAPFRALLVGAPAVLEEATAALARAGATAGDAQDSAAARILAGWPALGAEIDDKTLPQEVRYDEIDGVSYTKGCYTGQETVARLHFRGHANRELRGLLWRGPVAPTSREIHQSDGKAIGSIRSTLALPDRVFGLGIIRREVSPGDTILAGGHPAEVIALPFTDEHIEG